MYVDDKAPVRINKISIHYINVRTTLCSFLETKDASGNYGATDGYEAPPPYYPTKLGTLPSFREHDYASDWSESSGITVIELKRVSCLN